MRYPVAPGWRARLRNIPRASSREAAKRIQTGVKRSETPGIERKSSKPGTGGRTGGVVLPISKYRSRLERLFWRCGFQPRFPFGRDRMSHLPNLRPQKRLVMVPRHFAPRPAVTTLLPRGDAAPGRQGGENGTWPFTGLGAVRTPRHGRFVLRSGMACGRMAIRGTTA